MLKKSISYLLFSLSTILFLGCESENKNNQKTEIEPKNNIGKILKIESVLDYTKINIRTKIYEETIFYQIDLEYVAKILEVPHENEPNKKIKKDLSQVSYEEWINRIVDEKKDYKIALIFKDEDDFTILKEEVLIKKDKSDFSKGIFFEGSIKTDKLLSPKIHQLKFYQNFYK